MNKILNLILIILLTLAIITGAILGSNRFSAEQNNNALEIVISYKDLLSFANQNEVSLESVLHKFKENGLTSIALSEETLESAANKGELIYASGYQIKQTPLLLENITFADLLSKEEIKLSKSYLLINNDKTFARIKKELISLLGKNKVRSKETALEIDLPMKDLKTLGIGINPSTYKYLQGKGFKVIPRLTNNNLLNQNNIKEKISSLTHKRKIPAIIFEEKEVIGYPDYIKDTAKALRYHEIKYGKLEVLKQEGDIALASFMGDGVIRTHSIEKKQLRKLTPEKAVNRFTRAVKERNVRLIYFNPFPKTSLESNLDYLKSIKNALEKEPFIITQQTENPPRLRFNFLATLILGLGVTTGIILLINSVFTLPASSSYLILLLSIIFTVFFRYLGWDIWCHKTYALLAAITFPTYAVTSELLKDLSQKGNQFIKAFPVYINIILNTLLGIILIVGLLSDSRFMLGASLFIGTKLALVVPLFLTAAILAYKQQDQPFWQSLKSFFGISLKVWQIVLAGVAFLVLVILLLRSGNFGLPVPAFEKTIRSSLSQMLMVRPRFKEFIIGYPILLLACFYFVKGYKKWLWLLASIGTIALTSLTNTFCHIHSPLLISTIRSVNGLLIGTLFGLIAYLIFFRLIEKLEK